MKQVEVKLWEGMAKQGITGAAAEQIVKSITSFALYGFPESHSASFALLVYASAYLRAHFPAAFTAALLNNQPMGFYRPATLVKDAQRHGVRFAPIDVERSDWPCRVEEDGAVRLGLCYVTGLRRDVGMAIAGARNQGPGAKRRAGLQTRREASGQQAPAPGTLALGTLAPRRFQSVEDLIAKTGANRQELATLAEIGALNSFGYDRREALWQIEKAIRPAGELFEEREAECRAGLQTRRPRDARDPLAPGPWPQAPDKCPLPPMSPVDRLVTDYEGTGLTIGPHPMAMRRQELAHRGVLRAIDLSRQRHGRRVRVAGAVITRQRPGTAKGFVFLTLEDETGIANIIIRPDVFAGERLTIIEEPFLLIEGTLQNLDGVTSVRAERLEGLGGTPVEIDARNFY
jgi:error-prone DNA polymerase